MFTNAQITLAEAYNKGYRFVALVEHPLDPQTGETLDGPYQLLTSDVELAGDLGWIDQGRTFELFHLGSHELVTWKWDKKVVPLDVKSIELKVPGVDGSMSISPTPVAERK